MKYLKSLILFLLPIAAVVFVLLVITGLLPLNLFTTKQSKL